MLGLINLQNTDDKCFLWDHVRHLNPRKKDPQRITKSDREFAKKLDYSGITFPVTRNQINRSEKQNKINIYLFGYDTVKNLFIQFIQLILLQKAMMIVLIYYILRVKMN